MGEVTFRMSLKVSFLFSVFRNNVMMERVIDDDEKGSVVAKRLVMAGKNNIFNIHLKNVGLSYFVGVHEAEKRKKQPEVFRKLLK